MNEREEGRNKGSYNVKVEGKSSSFIFFIFLEILPENRVFYRDDVPSFLSPFESHFSEEWSLNLSETELIVVRLRSPRKRGKIRNVWNIFERGKETIKIRDKNYSQTIYSMIYFIIWEREIFYFTLSLIKQ